MSNKEKLIVAIRMILIILCIVVSTFLWRL